MNNVSVFGYAYAETSNEEISRSKAAAGFTLPHFTWQLPISPALSLFIGSMAAQKTPISE